MNNFKDKEKWKRNLSIALTGLKKPKRSKIHCERLSQWHLGRKHSKFTRIKMSLAQKGKPKSTEHARNIGLSKKGKKFSLESRKKMSISHMGKPAYWKGKKMPESAKKKIREARLKQVFPLKDTKPERILQFNLSVWNIEYSKHVTIIGQPDIFIKSNFCIFVDGDYWHSIPKVRGRDTYINRELRKLGFNVIRIPEKTIKEYPNLIAESLIGMVLS